MYFGLKFYWLIAVVSKSIPEIVPWDAMNTYIPDCNDMIEVISRDMKVLHDNKIGTPKKEWKPAEFHLLPLKEVVVYVYYHSEHASFSTIELSHLKKCNINISVVKPYELPMCNDHGDHIYLLPFFYDNFWLKNYCKGISQEDSTHSADLKLLERIEKEQSGQGTAFECPAGPVNNWKENDWTCRLAKGIERSFPDQKVTFSAVSDFSKVLCTLDVRFVSEQCYLFRGAPDIIISKHSALVDAASSSSTCSSEDDDEAIENCHQRTKLTGCTELDHPKKLGELIAALHCLLVSRS